VGEAEEIPLFFTLIPVLALLSNYDRENCLINVGTEGGQAKEVNAEEHIERGCALEVTDLRVGAASYCSVAFEAFPDDSAMHADFTSFVNSFFQHLPDVVLSESDSMGYPTWLHTV